MQLESIVRSTQVQEREIVAQRDDDKYERIGIPVVHSLKIFKMCEGLGLQAQLAAESDRQIWVTKKKPRPIPKVHSKTILMFCEALNLDAELAHSLGREHTVKTSSTKLNANCTA
ncbi:UNVERIFIED_CONTAM: hypothetical protein NCL1_60424 [Trichonephila clavipes]